MTGLEFVTGALRLVGAVASGETPEAAEANDALQIANDMLEGWSNERLTVHHFLTEEFTWPAGQTSRTIGTGGNFNTSRPIRIEHAYTKDSAGYATPLTVVNSQQYQSIREKTLAGFVPDFLFMDATFPLANLYLYPVPSADLTLGITSWKQFSSMTLAGDYALPKGYNELIRYSLAVRLFAEYGRAPREDVVALAERAMDRIKTVNLQVPVMDSDLDGLASGGGWDVYSGGFR